VFVVGDAAALECDGRAVPGVAPAAIQMGRQVARNLVGELSGRARRPFRYRDKGSLATIGRFAGVADFGRVRVSGPLAWMLWLSVHLFFLIGFRARVVLLFEWAWAWLSFQRVARVFSRPADRGPV
jgi:NADH dehydrogenase